MDVVYGFDLIRGFAPASEDIGPRSRPEPQRRRGHPLLTAWWLSVLVAANAYSRGSDDLKKAVNASQARHALREIMFSDGLHICAAGLSIVVVWQLIRRLERAAAIATSEVWTAG